ncbi:hypothetical protein IQ276_017090 [Desmonostoc muscorum LEGE 12446]|uniref:Tetratricopeptide repeat protein n=1 Tax=Desmonostoc muscorum LEGE 12446 TaxID=1828758 RepID=A0A8J6ZXY4_DESMC|nr:hypothetical protein [Desmonostoc muscorum]MCF2148109.1 hypothetical protein [Desmonostoc muscorum LEGE 12446]
MQENPVGDTFKHQILDMKNCDDWLGIYNLFAPLENLAQNHPDIWNNVEISNEIGFASGKLAETSSIPPDIFNNQERKKTFLNQQAKYRRVTENIRKRCVELAPENPGYWSSLAYLYYQNVQELKQPKGRRDGNIREEAETSIKYYEQALSIDNNRIADLYRKGYLLAQILPDQILFGKNKDNSENIFDLARQKRKEGITSLLKAIEIWESLNSTDEIQHEKRKRYRKEYIKSFYCTGRAYYDQIRKDWDVTVYALRLQKGISESDTISYSPQDWDCANKAWFYFYHCWLTDQQDSRQMPDEWQVNTTNTTNDGIDGVYKLYWLGKVSFAQYWILSGYGQKDTPEVIKYRDRAAKYLNAALNFSWSPENQRQNKKFIAELLARLYISQGDYIQAINVINDNCGTFLDDYIAHTLSLALILNNESYEAQKILERCSLSQRNRVIWESHFLIGCSHLSNGNFEQANQAFQKADEQARRQGKKTIDSLLIGRSFVAYKFHKKEEAIRYMKEANQINPYRVSVSRYLEKWQKSG